MTDRLTVRGTYSAMLRIYARWARQLIFLALVVFVPVGLIDTLVFQVEVTSIDFTSLADVLATTAAVSLLTISALMGEVFYTGAVAVFLTHKRDTKRPPLRRIGRSIRYTSLIGVDIVYGLAVAIGLILLIGPGVVAFVVLAMAAPLVEIEGINAREAFRRSFKLARGRFWVILAVLAPIQLLGEAITRLARSVAHGVTSHEFASHWIADVLTNIAFTPFYAVAAVLLTVTLIREKDSEGPHLRTAPTP